MKKKCLQYKLLCKNKLISAVQNTDSYILKLFKVEIRYEKLNYIKKYNNNTEIRNL